MNTNDAEGVIPKGAVKNTIHKFNKNKIQSSSSNNDGNQNVPITHPIKRNNNNNNSLFTQDNKFTAPRTSNLARNANQELNYNKEKNAFMHDTTNNVEIKEIDSEKKIYKTTNDGVTNYAKVNLLDNNNNNYIIEVREQADFEETKSTEDIEDLKKRLGLIKKLDNFVKETEESSKTGGKKRNTNKINKKSKKRIIKYKRNTKKSKR